jgi:hypothetical protein
VTVGGVSVNGTTTSLTVGVGLGSYGYQITPVSGYTVSPANGSITVGLSPNYNLNVAFASVSSSTSLVSTNTYNTGFAIAIAIAVIALLIGLLALFWPRRAKPSDNPAPPAAWTPPAGSSTPPPAAGTNTWSEGSGNPPS